MRATAGLILLVACGYTTGSVDSDPGQSPGRLPSIAVLPFDNLTFRRGLEIRLTRLLADEIRSLSPRSPEGPENADWLVTGTITRAWERVLSQDSGDFVRESSFWMTCEIVVRDRATDRIIETNTLTKFRSFSDRAGRFQTPDESAEETMRLIAEATVYWLADLESSRKK